jgi:hypothetical protein
MSRTVSALQGEAVTKDDGKSAPIALRPFDRWEIATVWFLIVFGALLILGTLLPFELSHRGGLVTKMTTTAVSGTTTKGTETDYDGTVVVFAITVGAAFLLTGTLYSRIRDITLGALKIDVGDEGGSKPPDDGGDKSATQQNLGKKQPGA